MVTSKLVFVSHLHSCRDKFAVSLQICSASLLQTKIAIWADSNFSLQQAYHKFVMTRVQACSKLTKASKSPWYELAASLPCKLIANYSKKQSTNTTRDRTRDLPVRKLTR
ncbi:hypothetical protein AVEN_148843-1 [Araneus ventricosus]|uniref:Uncharacterized protein n=1 Tax=Araneus ventricosus TaxID=182803 RepID=A0A4Y2MXQ1_ARAVE|nr:hypothetical protein AVEN_148843-1 [Araneus ventricosus]